MLEFVVNTDKSDPRYLFHLAAAYLGTQRPEEAARLFQESLQGGLENQILTAPDRVLLAELQELLKNSGSK